MVNSLAGRKPAYLITEQNQNNEYNNLNQNQNTSGNYDPQDVVGEASMLTESKDGFAPSDLIDPLRPYGEYFESEVKGVLPTLLSQFGIHKSNYIGPNWFNGETGSKVHNVRIGELVTPISEIDRLARRHDIEYIRSKGKDDLKRADLNLIKSLSELKDLDLLKNVEKDLILGLMNLKILYDSSGKQEQQECPECNKLKESAQLKELRDRSQHVVDDLVTHFEPLWKRVNSQNQKDIREAVLMLRAYNERVFDVLKLIKGGVEPNPGPRKVYQMFTPARLKSSSTFDPDQVWDDDPENQMVETIQGSQIDMRDRPSWLKKFSDYNEEEYYNFRKSVFTNGIIWSVSKKVVEQENGKEEIVDKPDDKDDANDDTDEEDEDLFKDYKSKATSLHQFNVANNSNRNKSKSSRVKKTEYSSKSGGKKEDNSDPRALSTVLLLSGGEINPGPASRAQILASLLRAGIEPNPGPEVEKITILSSDNKSVISTENKITLQPLSKANDLYSQNLSLNLFPLIPLLGEIPKATQFKFLELVAPDLRSVEWTMDTDNFANTVRRKAINPSLGVQMYQMTTSRAKIALAWVTAQRSRYVRTANKSMLIKCKVARIGFASYLDASDERQVSNLANLQKMNTGAIWTMLGTLMPYMNTSSYEFGIDVFTGLALRCYAMGLPPQVGITPEMVDAQYETSAPLPQAGFTRNPDGGPVTNLRIAAYDASDWCSKMISDKAFSLLMNTDWNVVVVPSNAAFGSTSLLAYVLCSIGFPWIEQGVTTQRRNNVGATGILGTAVPSWFNWSAPFPVLNNDLHICLVVTGLTSSVSPRTFSLTIGPTNALLSQASTIAAPVLITNANAWFGPQDALNAFTWWTKLFGSKKCLTMIDAMLIELMEQSTLPTRQDIPVNIMDNESTGSPIPNYARVINDDGYEHAQFRKSPFLTISSSIRHGNGNFTHTQPVWNVPTMNVYEKIAILLGDTVYIDQVKYVDTTSDDLSFDLITKTKSILFAAQCVDYMAGMNDDAFARPMAYADSSKWRSARDFLDWWSMTLLEENGVPEYRNLLIRNNRLVTTVNNSSVCRPFWPSIFWTQDQVNLLNNATLPKISDFERYGNDRSIIRNETFQSTRMALSKVWNDGVMVYTRNTNYVSLNMLLDSRDYTRGLTGCISFAENAYLRSVALDNLNEDLLIFSVPVALDWAEMINNVMSFPYLSAFNKALGRYCLGMSVNGSYSQPMISDVTSVVGGGFESIMNRGSLKKTLEGSGSSGSSLN